MNQSPDSNLVDRLKTAGCDVETGQLAIGQKIEELYRDLDTLDVGA